MIMIMIMKQIEEILNLGNLTRSKVIHPYLRRLFESKKALQVTRKRVAQLMTNPEPDKEIMDEYSMYYTMEMQVGVMELFNDIEPQNASSNFDTLSDVVQNHCIFAALTHLKEKFSPERVALVEKFVISEKSSSSKGRRRYVKVTSGKRQRVGSSLDGQPMEYLPMGMSQMPMM